MPTVKKGEIYRIREKTFQMNKLIEIITPNYGKHRFVEVKVLSKNDISYNKNIIIQYYNIYEYYVLDAGLTLRSKLDTLLKII